MKHYHKFMLASAALMLSTPPAMAETTHQMLSGLFKTVGMSIACGVEDTQRTDQLINFLPEKAAELWKTHSVANTQASIRSGEKIIEEVSLDEKKALCAVVVIEVRDMKKIAQ